MGYIESEVMIKFHTCVKPFHGAPRLIGQSANLSIRLARPSTTCSWLYHTILPQLLKKLLLFCQTRSVLGNLSLNL